VGPRDNQDVRAPAVSRAGHPQRPRVRRGRRPGCRVGFVKEGNCLTGIADPQRLARVADTLSQPAAIGRLGQVCDRWIYSACLCFGLDFGEQARSGFAYSHSACQAEYSRNLLFRSGGQMQDLFNRVLDRTRSRLDIPCLRTVFGLKDRPHRNRASGPPAQEIVTGKPSVRPDLVQGPLRAPAAEGLPQRRARAAHGGHRPQHQRAALRPQPGDFPEITTRIWPR
jgi:hypothetical protein